MSKWRERYEAARRAQQQAERDRAATRRLALHESAHAAVCFALSVPFRRVAVWWDDTFRQQGVVELEDVGSADRKSLLIVHSAGPASDVFFYGADPDLYGADNQNAITVADDIARVEGGDWYAIVQHGRRRAEELVAQNAEAIRSLARELMQAHQHEMAGRQVEDFLERAGVQRGGLAPGRAPQPGQEQYFERRDGITRLSANPDPQRRTSVSLWRTDGYIA
jgi:hypothetical protein